MAKEHDTRSKLEEIVFTELRKVRESGGMTGIKIYGAGRQRSAHVIKCIAIAVLGILAGIVVCILYFGITL
jgi:hypothetical protein